jgi:hypothetical protein
LGLCLFVGSLLTPGMVARLGNVPALLSGWMRGANTWVDHANGDLESGATSRAGQPHPGNCPDWLGQAFTFTGLAWQTSQHRKPVRKAQCLRRFSRFRLESDPQRWESFSATS